MSGKKKNRKGSASPMPNRSPDFVKYSATRFSPIPDAGSHSSRTHTPLSTPSPVPENLSKVAIILLNDAHEKDVSEAALTMQAAKIRRDGNEVRCINMINCTVEDLHFLYASELSEIAVVGHSSAVDPDGRTYLPMRQRKVGNLRVNAVGRLMEMLAHYTKASRYVFYPCEIADRFVDQTTELREQENPGGSTTHHRALEENRDIEELANDSTTSTLDVIRGYIQNGLIVNPRRETNETTLEGQVGPGDPSRSPNPASPRGSISREEARTLIGASDYTTSRQERKRADKLETRGKKALAKTDWELQTIRLSEESASSRFTEKVSLNKFITAYNVWKTRMIRNQIQKETSEDKRDSQHTPRKK
ncbi:MAG: hypothetical protein P1U32_03950 [Legionellaceae bacterium]|nr:hypothetical protein [Legionellaceae bacterium]